MSSKKDKKIIEEAIKFYDSIAKKQAFARRIGEECAYMIAGDQWKPEDEQARKNDGNRPVITVNQMAKPVDYKINMRHESQSSIKYHPWEEDDEDTGEVINGVVRHIENSNNSNGKEAYNHADKCAIINGFGYYRIDAKFCDEMSMDQDLVINPIRDPMSVHMDWFDHSRCLITERLTKSQFVEKYPGKECGDWGQLENSFALGEDECIVAEYWVEEKTPEEIYKVRRLKQKMFDGAPDEHDEMVVTKGDLLPDDEIIGEPRKTMLTKVVHYLLSPSEILEQNEWPGKHIPVLGVYGNFHTNRDGDIFPKPMMYDSIGPQRLINYNKSCQAEAMQEAVRPIPVGAKGQFGTGKSGAAMRYQWQHHSKYSFLEYNLVDINGKPAPPPMPFPRNNVVSEYTQAGMEYKNDLDMTSGVFDPTRGVNPKGDSGKALLAQQSVSNLGLAHFDYNSDAAKRQAGIIILDLFPHIYDSERTICILGEDMREKVIKINQQYEDKDGAHYYDTTKKINCDVMVQASYSAGTRRLQVVEMLMEYAERFPQTATVISDLVADNLDMDKSDELRDRARALIPNELWARIKQMRAEEKGKATPEMVQLQQMGAMVQQMQGELQKSRGIIQNLAKENEGLKKKIDDSKLQVENVRQRGDIREEEIRRRKDLEVEEMRQEGANYRERLKLQGRGIM